MTNTTRTRRSVPSYSPGARRLQLRIAGILEVKRLTRLAVAVGVLAGMLGCHGTVPPPTTETIGTLSAGPSTWTAPVHATTDFGHAEIVETGDDDRTATVTTTVRADAGGADAAELPDVAPKTDGVTTGAVR